MKYLLLVLVIVTVVFAWGPAKHRSPKSCLPEFGWLEISGGRIYEGGVRRIDCIRVYFDTAGTRLNAGDVYLDNQRIPWSASNEEYYLDYGQGFRYQPDHAYVFRVTGSARVPAFSIDHTSAGPDVSVTAPHPGDTVIVSRGLRVAWQPRGQVIGVSLTDSQNQDITYEDTDTGAVYFSPAQLESLTPGRIELSVYHMMMIWEYPGFMLIGASAVGEGMNLQLKSVGIEEKPGEISKQPACGFSVRPQPARNHLTICLGSGKNERVVVDVFDAGGRCRCRLYEGYTTSQGPVVMNWNLRDAQERPLAPGVYFLQARGGTFSAATKFLVTR